jgi:Uma2 family endonuclease
MLTAPELHSFYDAFAAAEELGVKLEIQGGLLLWDLMPSPAHTIAVKRLEQSIRPNLAAGECGCFSYQDMYVRFPDGSYKRPDLAIYCTEVPPTLEAATIIPGAVIEVVSQSSREKDFRLAPPFYLSHGVRDVVVVDPATGTAKHFQQGVEMDLTAPATIHLAMGCSVTVSL